MAPLIRSSLGDLVVINGHIYINRNNKERQSRDLKFSECEMNEKSKDWRAVSKCTRNERMQARLISTTEVL